jgi:hypothetical protein
MQRHTHNRKRVRRHKKACTGRLDPIPASLPASHGMIKAPHTHGDMATSIFNSSHLISPTHAPTSLYSLYSPTSPIHFWSTSPPSPTQPPKHPHAPAWRSSPSRVCAISKDSAACSTNRRNDAHCERSSSRPPLPLLLALVLPLVVLPLVLLPLVVLPLAPTLPLTLPLACEELPVWAAPAWNLLAPKVMAGEDEDDEEDDDKEHNFRWMASIS